MTRINKYLSSCGLGSRRKVEELITKGRIAVNGKKINNLAVQIDAENDLVTFDTVPVKPLNIQYYLMLNKPRGYLTTVQDDRERPTVMDLIPEKFKRSRLFPVGRLDKDTEGLLLFTNDGDLANKLSRPDSKVEKIYQVELDRPLSDHDKSKIEQGIYIHQINIKTRRAKIDYLDKSQRVVSIKIKEGKKRQIRYTFKNFNYKVKNLTRIAYGPLSLNKLNRGDFRLLKSKEIKLLKSIIN